MILCMCSLLWAHVSSVNSVQDLIDSGEIKRCLLTDGTLQLSHKKLCSLQGLENFVLAQNIKVIDLSHNLLEDLSVFNNIVGLEDLRELHVICNKLRVVDLGQFSTLPMLYVLNLGFNQITEVKPSKNWALKNLEVLFLNNNLINILHANVFVACSHLQALYLQNNNINMLEHNCLSGLCNLRLLYLYDNMLKILPENIFESLQNLYILYVRNNKLSKLEPGWSTGLELLEILDLANNNLSGINTKDIGVNYLKNLKYCYS